MTSPGPTTPVSFTARAAARVIDAARAVESQLQSGIGTLVPAKSYSARQFWARITASSGSAPFHYAWEEMYESGGALAVRPGGRSGTTSSNYALNVLEDLDTSSPPISDNADVLMFLTFDSSGNPVWRFVAAPDCTGGTTKVLARGEGTPRTATWNRSTDKCPVQIQITDTYWSGSANTLYKNVTTLIFDSCGRLQSASAETQATVDAAAVCT